MKMHPFLSCVREILSLLWVLTHFMIICLLLITWLPVPIGFGIVVALIVEVLSRAMKEDV